MPAVPPLISYELRDFHPRCAYCGFWVPFGSTTCFCADKTPLEECYSCQFANLAVAADCRHGAIPESLYVGAVRASANVRALYDQRRYLMLGRDFEPDKNAKRVVRETRILEIDRMVYSLNTMLRERFEMARSGRTSAEVSMLGMEGHGGWAELPEDRGAQSQT